MNFANLPISILFFAVVYLISIYGLLSIAQMLNQQTKIVASNTKKNHNQIEIP
jgi:hypothetical protein